MLRRIFLTTAAAFVVFGTTTAQSSVVEVNPAGQVDSLPADVRDLLDVDGALCEPSKDLAFPELKTRRRVRVNTSTGSTEFFEHDDQEAKEEY